MIGRTKDLEGARGAGGECCFRQNQLRRTPRRVLDSDCSHGDTCSQCKGPVSGMRCADAESSEDTTDRDRGTEGKVVGEVRARVAATPQRGFAPRKGLSRVGKRSPCSL